MLALVDFETVEKIPILYNVTTITDSTEFVWLILTPLQHNHHKYLILFLIMAICSRDLFIYVDVIRSNQLSSKKNVTGNK